MRTLVFIFYSCLIAGTGCAHRGLSHNETPVKLDSPMLFEVSGDKGYREKQNFYSNSNQKTYVGSQIAHERDETSEFTVENVITDVSKDPVWIEVKQKTLEKSGSVELNRMAFPELGEEIIYRYGRLNNVLKAHPFPERSIFYISPVPLPEIPVEVGDTWSYKENWVDYLQGLEMTVDLVGVLKNTFRCYVNEICLEIEYSGNIYFPKPLQEASKFKGTVDARFLYRPHNSSILRSEIYNTEYAIHDDGHLEVKSCIVSQLVGTSTTTLKCKPK